MIFTVRESKRLFSQAGKLYKGTYSLVNPTHHIERYDKRVLMESADNSKTPSNDIKAKCYIPLDVRQDRLTEHYYNSLQSDMLLMAYDHSETFTPGPIYREIDNLSNPYLINKTKPSLFGKSGSFLDRYPITPKNIPELLDVEVSCIAKDVNVNKYNYITAKALIQQITNVQPQNVVVTDSDHNMYLRVGSILGGKVNLYGYDKSQFLLTLNELIFPKDENFSGIPEHLADPKGHITLQLSSEQVSFFPEIMSDKDLWDSLLGMTIKINTTAQDPAYTKMLLSGLGFPFRSEGPLEEPERV